MLNNHSGSLLRFQGFYSVGATPLALKKLKNTEGKAVFQEIEITQKTQQVEIPPTSPDGGISYLRVGFTANSAIKDSRRRYLTNSTYVYVRPEDERQFGQNLYAANISSHCIDDLKMIKRFIYMQDPSQEVKAEMDFRVLQQTPQKYLLQMADHLNRWFNEEMKDRKLSQCLNLKA